ncbi:hypothetical protein AAAU23_02975 [Faecalibacterium butyricigenerans]
MIATIRSREISASIILQSQSQLKWKEQQEQEQAEQLPLAAEQKGEHIA